MNGSRTDIFSVPTDYTVRREPVFYQCTRDGSSFSFLSPAAAEIAGVSAETIPLRLKELLLGIPVSDRAAVLAFLRTLFSGKPAVVQFSFTNARCNRYILKHTAHPLFIEGSLTGFAGCIEDITAETDYLTLLEHKQKQLSTLFENAEDFIFILNSGGTFTSVNQNGAYSLEYTPGEMIGKHFFEFIDDKHRSETAQAFKSLLTATKVITFETTFHTKYGKKYPFQVKAVTLFEGKKVGNVLGIARNIHDRGDEHAKITELTNLLKESNRIIAIERERVKQRITVLEELNSMKNEFVSNISHELRTPLASIVGFSESIDSDPTMSDSMKKEFNKIILTESKRLSQLINNVLDISRLEGGNISLNKGTFNIVELINEVVTANNQLAQEKHIILTNDMPLDEVNVFGDRDRLEQLFDNIINNAIRYTPEHGRVTVFGKYFRSELEVIVSDTGIGINKEDMPYLFQPFFHTGQKKSINTGPGLGLALAKRIIDLHRGLLTVQSEEQKGTTVIIKLPSIPE